VLVVPIPDPGLGNISYLVDLGDGSALVVDPERDPRPYLEAATGRRLAIRHVVETHLHADFVSGARELMAFGARLIAPGASHLAYPHQPVEDGDEIEIGDLRLQVVATPGHTPEHVSYVLLDGGSPKVAFTGGTLMVGGVARPDLVSPSLTRGLAGDAFHSVRRLLGTLPDDVEVRPTHGGGSFCSSGPGSTPSTSTIGSERLGHPAARATSEQAFVDELLAGLGSYPTYFGRLREVNQRGAVTFGVDLPKLQVLDPAGLAGVTIIDVRPIERFAAGHIPGSVSIELRGQFGTWLGWLFEPTVPLAFVLDPGQDERDLVAQVLNIGHEALAGRISVADWVAGGRPLATIGLIGADQVRAGAQIVDVRQDSEWDAGHVPGAVHLELGQIAMNAGRVEAGAVVHCGHGQRAMTAASLLARAGIADVSVTRAGHGEITTSLPRR